MINKRIFDDYNLSITFIQINAYNPDRIPELIGLIVQSIFDIKYQDNMND